MKRLSIGFFGDGRWALDSLSKFKKDKKILIKFICLRYLNPDKNIIKFANKNNIKIFIKKNINNSVNELSKIKCDLFISIAYNQIFRQALLSLPALKSINCHAGKLPFYRGRNILNWALINGEKSFGITVHFIDLGIDTGDIIIQKEYRINETDDYSSLLEKCYTECPKLTYKAVEMIYSGNVRTIKQDSINKHGSYCRGRKEGDEIINWNNTSQNIHNFIRGINYPGPLARTYFKNKELKIIKSRVPNKKQFKNFAIGEVLKITKHYIYVKTKNNYIICKVKNGTKNLTIGTCLKKM